MHDEPIEVIPAVGGGLGNQMFQIAMAHVFARQLGGVLALDEDVWESYGQGNGTRTYCDGLFSRIRRTRLRQDAHLVSELQWKPGRRPELKPPRGTRQIFLRGCWQIPALWECDHQEIRELFQFEVSRNSLSGVHIRGGDYAAAHSTRGNPFHSQPGAAYYEAAMANLSTYPDFYTDDSALLRAIAPEVAPVSGSESDHFSGMAACSELVLSKSTFSWWAAFLGMVPFVIMPAAWFWEGEFQPSWAMRIDGWEVFSPNSTLWNFHRWHRTTMEAVALSDEILSFPSEDWSPWDSLTEILNDLICLIDARSYLEIGCEAGMNLRAVECDQKSTMEAAAHANVCDAQRIEEESDGFPDRQERLFDMIAVRHTGDAAVFGERLARAVGMLRETGVLVCDGLEDERCQKEWIELRRRCDDWVFIGVGCESGVGLAFRHLDFWHDPRDREGAVSVTLLPPDEAKAFVHALLMRSKAAHRDHSAAL